MNILYAWTVNSVNRLYKNPKHMTAITSPSKPGHLHHKQLVKNVKIILFISNARLLACNVDGKVLGLDENGITVMWFEILNQSVHRINCPYM